MTRYRDIIIIELLHTGTEPGVSSHLLTPHLYINFIYCTSQPALDRACCFVIIRDAGQLLKIDIVWYPISNYEYIRYDSTGMVHVWYRTTCLCSVITPRYTGNIGTYRTMVPFFSPGGTTVQVLYGTVQYEPLWTGYYTVTQ